MRFKGIQNLPSDVILKLLQYLDCDDVARFKRLNKTIKSIILEHKHMALPPVSFRIDYLTDPAVASEVPELVNNIRVTVRTIRGPFRVVTNCSLVAMVDGSERDRQFFSHVHEYLREREVPSQDPGTFRVFLDWIFARMNPEVLELNIPLYDYMRRAFERSLLKANLSFKLQKLNIEHIREAEREGLWFMWNKRELTMKTQLELRGKYEYKVDSFAGAVRLNEYSKYYAGVTIRESVNNLYALMFCIVKEWVRQNIKVFNFRILLEDDEKLMTTNQLDFRNKFKTEHQFDVYNVMEPHFQTLHKLPSLFDQRKIEFRDTRQRRILRFTADEENGCACITMKMAKNGRIA